MTFGATCSPNCAQYVKNVNADRFEKEFPAAVRCIKEQHYVDDLLASTDREEEAIKLVKDISFIHSQGGFELHNWMSNSDYVSQSSEFRDGKADKQTPNREVGLPKMDKILGMWWDRKSDCFSFRPSAKQDQELLDGATYERLLMSIYDPLRLIAGFLFYLKVISDTTPNRYII